MRGKLDVGGGTVLARMNLTPSKLLPHDTHTANIFGHFERKEPSRMRMTIRTKLLLGFTVIMILVVMGYLVAEYRLDRIERATSKIHEEWSELSLSNQAQSSLEETVRILANFIISGDEKQKDRIHQALQAGVQSVEQLEQLQRYEMGRIPDERLHTETELRWISSIKQDFAEVESAVNALIALPDPKADAGATRLFDQVDQHSQKVIASLAQFRKFAQGALDHSIRIARQEEDLSDRVLLISVLSMIALGFAFSLLFARSIARSVGNLKKRSQQIGRGIFDYPVSISSGDEIGDLDRALHRMALNLKGLYGNLEGMVKKKEEELQQAQSLAAIGQMVSIVAHDFRNPLQNIYMGVDTLRNEMVTDKDRMEILEEIDYSVNLLNGIVSELLDYSKPVHLKYSKSSVRNLVGHALDALSNRLQNTAVDLDFEQEEREILADAVMMNRVFVNIISNAADAMPQGGNLRVRSRFSDCNGQSLLTISISDNGCGIPEELLGRISEPFFTTKARGTGLGIPICKKIVNAHKGIMTITSKVSKGATVEIRLPVGDHDALNSDTTPTRVSEHESEVPNQPLNVGKM